MEDYIPVVRTNHRYYIRENANVALSIKIPVDRINGDRRNIYRVKQRSTREILSEWRHQDFTSGTRGTLEGVIVTMKGKAAF